MKKLLIIPLLLLLTGCPSKNDPHTHNIWIKCKEDKSSPNITPEEFMVDFTITHSSDHQHQEKSQFTIKKGEVSRTILWRNNLSYAVTPYFSIVEIALHINERGVSNLNSRNIQYHINRNTLDFSYTYSRSDVQSDLISKQGGIITIKAGQCSRIKNPMANRSI